MIVTFCGHAQYHATSEHELQILAFLEETIKNMPACIYLGQHGDFDRFAYHCCKKYKKSHPAVSLVFVTPYLRTKGRELQSDYDVIIYPEIENKPPRFAITYRNRYMVDQADYVVAYVSRNWGGAYEMYRYARKKGKKILNLANFEE
jgi:uncharacterized phage-like protein YoqJ